MEINDNLSFGQRLGLEPIEIPFQINEIDTTLRTDLWNLYYLFIDQPIVDADSYQRQSYVNSSKKIWMSYFKKAVDDYPKFYSVIRTLTRKHFEEGLWYKVYEFVEFLFLNLRNGLFQLEDFEIQINKALKRNNSGFSLTNGKFIPVTNEVEINEIKTTQSLSVTYNLAGIQQHLNSSLELISLKPVPDFRNSIKESISMVEVISRIIEPQNTLGKALNKLDKNEKINSTLKAGFEKLYAYTNDKNGIRHALMDDENVDIEDAKFFLVSCSAFSNYLIEKAIKDKLLFNN
jgi:hypothetical protein